MATIRIQHLFSWRQVESNSDLERLKLVMEAIGDEELMVEMEKERKGRRDDYPIRAVWNSILAGIVFEHNSIESLRRELKRNAELREMCGFSPIKGCDGVPPHWVYTRFLKKLIKHREKIRQMFDKLVEEIKKELPDLGEFLAIDSKEIKSHSKGKKEAEKSSDPEADWGKKEYKGKNEDGSVWSKIKKWFGYKLHLIVDAKYELAVEYEITKASVNDNPMLLKEVKKIDEKHPEIVEDAKVLIADKGYDSEPNCRQLYDEYGIKPVIDIREMWREEKEDDVKTRMLYSERLDNIGYNNKGEVFCYSPATAQEREMAFMGFEQERKCLKYRCPAAAYDFECKGKRECGTGKYGDYGRIVRIPLDTDRRIFTPIARSSYVFEKIYNLRGSVERVFSRIDGSFCYENHFIKGKAKMEVRMGLSLVVMLSMSLGRIKRNQKELIRSLVKAA